MSGKAYTIVVDHEDWPGCMVLRYGRIVTEAYRLVRSNPRATAMEAAFIARQFHYDDGSVEPVDSVMQRARIASTEESWNWRNDRVRYDRDHS